MGFKKKLTSSFKSLALKQNTLLTPKSSSALPCSTENQRSPFSFLIRHLEWMLRQQSGTDHLLYCKCDGNTAFSF